MRARTIKIKAEWLPAFVVIIRAGLVTVIAAKLADIDQNLVDYLHQWCDKAKESWEKENVKNEGRNGNRPA